MQSFSCIVLLVCLAGVQCGVLPLVTVGQSLAAHSIDHSLAAQVVPLVAAAPQPLVAAAPQPLVAAAPQPLVAAAPQPFLPYARPPLFPAPAPLVPGAPLLGPAPARFALPSPFFPL